MVEKSGNKNSTINFILNSNLFYLFYGYAFILVKPAYEEVLIAPVVGYMQWAEGDIITPKGMIHVKWNMEGEHRRFEVLALMDIKVIVSEDFNHVTIN